MAVLKKFCVGFDVMLSILGIVANKHFWLVWLVNRRPSTDTVIYMKPYVNV